jgi:23S rRNA (guanosine2251-2'-O)-methyltransferase
MNLEIESKIIAQIHSLGRELETNTQDGEFSEEKLATMTGLLHQLEFSQDENLQKLARIKDHLYPTMSLRHFSNFLIPLERWLDRNLSDDHFLVSELDQNLRPQTTRPIYFILDNLRSAFNVGSIFRLADCVGATEIILCGYTATPENSAVQKTSMNTSELVRYRHCDRIEDALTEFKSKGIQIIALETADHAVSLYHKPMTGPCAFVVGNERFGIDRKILSMVDEVRSIPVFGTKNSLNVANALSIAAFEWSRQNS